MLLLYCCASKWRGKSFIFEGEGLRIMVFQSAPPALEGPPSAPRPREEELEAEAEAEAEQAARSKTAERARYHIQWVCWTCDAVVADLKNS